MRTDSSLFVGTIRTCPVLREDFMKPLGLTVNRLALELHVRATRIGEIVHQRRRITAETALRLAGYFDTNAEFWLNLQNFLGQLILGTDVFLQFQISGRIQIRIIEDALQNALDPLMVMI
ncbi:MAG: HigA family addiction module antitoxin [Candidatus Acidiferrum sp.]